MRNSLGAFATVLGLLLATTAQAGHHLWDFTECYSNATGSTQFVEMLCTADGEPGLGAWSIVSGATTFNFVTDTPNSSTNGKHVLLATSNFASLPGAVTPDYIIPANFCATGGGTLDYAGGLHVWNYGALPTDGIHSLLRGNVTAVNSPTNWAGATGSINQATSVPMVQTWGLILLVGAMLFAASGLLSKRDAPAV
jgi:hypothetical protein